MRFDVITLFPEMVLGPVRESILGRALQAGLIEINAHDPREHAEGKHRQVDDAPFGGGDGMVMKPDVLARAIRAVKEKAPGSPVILLCAQGKVLSQELAREWAKLPGLILVCGHYAGVDERVRELLVDGDLSIGDYVISGGEPAAWVTIDAVSRLIPGVLGNEVSAEMDSFPARLEAPQYTRPAEFEGKPVPEVLLSGHHEKIERWRRRESLKRTLLKRPDLLDRHPPSGEELKILAEIRDELGLDEE